MSISYTIPGVPLLNQLTEASNPRDDCVFESNAALATCYLGRGYNATQIKALDPYYGPAYIGTASEARLVTTMAALGISVARISAPTQAGLVAVLHTEIARGHGVIVTMPSQWNSAPSNAAYAPWNPRTYSGPSHVGLACGVGAGMIRVMNPWGGFWQDQSDAWWAQRLLYGEVWVGTKANGGGSAMATGVPNGWHDDGTSLTNPANSFTVSGPFRDFILSNSWFEHDYPIEPESQQGQVELSNPAKGGGFIQRFHYTQLARGTTGAAWRTSLGDEAKFLRAQVGAQNHTLAAIKIALGE